MIFDIMERIKFCNRRFIQLIRSTIFFLKGNNNRIAKIIF